MDIIYTYISSLLYASSRFNFMAGEKLPKRKIEKGFKKKIIIFWNVRTGLKLFLGMLRLDFGVDKW